jgi:hypothetical protein
MREAEHHALVLAKEKAGAAAPAFVSTATALEGLAEVGIEYGVRLASQIAEFNAILVRRPLSGIRQVTIRGDYRYQSAGDPSHLPDHSELRFNFSDQPSCPFDPRT